MTILRLAESFKTITWPRRLDRPHPAQPDYDASRLWRFSMAYFSESIEDKDVKFSYNFYSSLKFVLYNFCIDIFDS